MFTVGGISREARSRVRHEMSSILEYQSLGAQRNALGIAALEHGGRSGTAVKAAEYGIDPVASRSS